MKQFKTRVNKCLDIVKSDYGCLVSIPEANDILLNLEYMWDTRVAYTTYNSKATDVPNIISLNVNYVKDYDMFFENEIIPHELAHVICFNNVGDECHHGDMWTQLCRSMGGSGNEFVKMEL